MKIEIDNDNGKKEKYFNVENSLNSFLVIEKEAEEKNNEDYGFDELSFKDIYKSNSLFEHVIEHINLYFSKNDSKNDNIYKNLKTITEFINQNRFTEEILEIILLNGIPNNIPCLRPLIWKCFIGYFPPNDLSKWKSITINNYKVYNSIKKKYSYYPTNIEAQADQKLIIQLTKDLKRTRRNVPFFQNKSGSKKNPEEINDDVIKRMLFYFAKEHSLSYVQGMNEIIALLYYIFANDDNPFLRRFVESDTYFCFCILVKEIEPIFRLNDISYSDLFITKQIDQINKILAKIEPDILNYFKEIEFSIDSFVMRWVMVLFAQEFKIDVAVNFWDRMFTQKNKTNFICFISVAILQINKDKIINKEIEDIADWTKEMGNNISKLDINEIIKKAFEIKRKYKELTGNK